MVVKRVNQDGKGWGAGHRLLKPRDTIVSQQVGRDTCISENEFLVHFIDENGEEIELDDLLEKS